MNIRRFRRYVRPPLPRASVPLQFVSEYDITTANQEAKMVMLAGYARTPFEAQKLMEKYGVKTARDLLPLLPPLRRRVNPLSRLANIIMRIEGARRGALRIDRDNRLPLHYRFKDKP